MYSHLVTSLMSAPLSSSLLFSFLLTSHLFFFLLLSFPLFFSLLLSSLFSSQFFSLLLSFPLFFSLLLSFLLSFLLISILLPSPFLSFLSKRLHIYLFIIPPPSFLFDIKQLTGDMDFKIAGTAKGITAMQLDVKLRYNIFLLFLLSHPLEKIHFISTFFPHPDLLALGNAPYLLLRLHY